VKKIKRGGSKYSRNIRPLIRKNWRKEHVSDEKGIALNHRDIRKNLVILHTLFHDLRVLSDDIDRVWIKLIGVYNRLWYDSLREKRIE
jgi:hypothetical protein